MRYTEIISEITRARMSRYMGGGGELDLWSVPARRERLLRSSKPLSDIAGLNYYVEKTSLGYEIFVIDQKLLEFPAKSKIPPNQLLAI